MTSMLINVGIVILAGIVVIGKDLAGVNDTALAWDRRPVSPGT